jgi:tetratricopeptide (TPR) repeat protein
MYYRYSSRRKRGGLFKKLVIFAAVAGVVYSGWHFRSYLQFWKLSFSRLDTMVEGVDRNLSAAERLERLKPLVAKAERFRSEDELSADACYISGRVFFLLGEALNGRSYGAMLVEGGGFTATPAAREAFLKSILSMKKAMALGSPSDEDILFLAKSARYIDFYSVEETGALLDSIAKPDTIRFPDDAWFYAGGIIASGRAEDGLKYLKARKASDPFSRLVLASAYAEAKQYTAAIAEYRSLLAASIPADVSRRAALNLGRVYFSQSLFNEALDTLEPVVAAEETDPETRLLMERVYRAAGDEVKAKIFAALPAKPLAQGQK